MKGKMDEKEELSAGTCAKGTSLWLMSASGEGSTFYRTKFRFSTLEPSQLSYWANRDKYFF